jgi:hypothetical protein
MQRNRKTAGERLAAEARRRHTDQARRIDERQQAAIGFGQRLAAALAVTDDTYAWQPWGYLPAEDAPSTAAPVVPISAARIRYRRLGSAPRERFKPPLAVRVGPEGLVYAA